MTPLKRGQNTLIKLFFLRAYTCERMGYLGGVMKGMVVRKESAFMETLVNEIEQRF